MKQCLVFQSMSSVGFIGKIKGTMLNKIAAACRIKCKAGMIWVPPTGRPYWIEYPNSTRELTDAEIREYINGKTPNTQTKIQRPG